MTFRTRSTGTAGRLRAHVRTFDPANFTLVMATGIVSMAAHLLGLAVVARSLFVANVVCYAVLLGLAGARAVLHPRAVLAEATDYEGVAVLALVAATCIVGTQVVAFTDRLGVGVALWVFGACCWLVLTYAVFAGVTVRQEDVSLSEGLDGAWLLAIVATQSVSALGVAVSPAVGRGRVVLFVSLCTYLLGGLLYLVVITLVFYRLTFFAFPPTSARPPYWINMGAVAITTFAGTALLAAAGSWSLLAELAPFLTGFTLFFWVVGTWWIPLLVVLGVWRHVLRDVPPPYAAHGYHPGYWSMVFPLGMYTAATYRLGRTLELGFVAAIADYFVYVALLAWVAVAVGLARTLADGRAP